MFEAPGPHYKEDPGQEAWNVRMRSMVQELLEMYLFANKYDIPQLRRDVTDTLVQLSNTQKLWFILAAQSIIAAFASPPSGSPMLQLLVDILTQNWGEADVPDDRLITSGYVDVPKEFFLGVMKNRIVKKNNKNARLDLQLCSYHGHEIPKDS